MLCVWQEGDWTLTSAQHTETDLGSDWSISVAPLFFWQTNSSFPGMFAPYRRWPANKEMNYETLSYPCFGTVLALRDILLHLVHLQLMREIPHQQFLRARFREWDTSGASDRFARFKPLSDLELLCMDPWVFMRIYFFHICLPARCTGGYVDQFKGKYIFCIFLPSVGKHQICCERRFVYKLMLCLKLAKGHSTKYNTSWMYMHMFDPVCIIFLLQKTK